MSGACGPRASVPEPPPVPIGQVVPVHLIAELSKLHHSASLSGLVDVSTHLNELIVLVEERNAFGVAKYGQPLMTEDGRNGLEDARQELGDLLQYVCKMSLCAKNNKNENDSATSTKNRDFLNLLTTALFVMRQLLK
jgi:hypothetical protein